MGEIRSKFTKFLNFLSRKRKLIVVFSVLIILGLTLPLFAAQALWPFGDIASGIGKAIGHLVAGMMLAIPMALLGIASVILGWAMDPWFIRMPYTSGGVVEIGWPIVRDLANMGIVLTLVVIGLATALRLEERQARKTLPRLIIVALLINFTPVILGFIVDATNILMEFFLEETTGLELIANQFTAVSSMIASDLGGFNFLDPLKDITFIIKILIIAIFDIFAAILFWMFAFLFIVRRVVIWMLVIFSPLAFLSWVLPDTRRIWTMWWNQFAQWSIIGLFAAFFLYLGEQMIMLAAHGGFVAEVPPGGIGGFMAQHVVDVLNQVLPYFVALLFLLFGFFIALNASSAFGAASTRGVAKMTGAAAAGFVGRRAATWGRQRWEESEKAKAFREKAAKFAQAKTPEPMWGRTAEGEGKSGIAAWAQRRAAWGTRAATAPLWAGARATGRTIGPGWDEVQKKTATKAESESEKQTPTMVGSRIRSAASWAEKIGLVNRLIKQPGDLDEALDKGAITLDEIEQIRAQAVKYDLHKEIDSALPILREDDMREAAGVPPTPTPLSPADRKLLVEKYKEITDRIMRKPERAGQLSRRVLRYDAKTDTYKYAPILESMIRTWDGRPTGNFVRAHGTEAMNAIEKTVRKLALAEKKTSEQWLKDNNERLLTYMRSSAGRGAGFAT